MSGLEEEIGTGGDENNRQGSNENDGGIKDKVKPEDKSAGAKKPEKADSKRRSKAAVAVAAILFSIAAVGIIGFILSNAGSQPDHLSANFAEYPTVSGTLGPSEDGKSHVIEVDLTLEYAEGEADSVSQEAVYQKMQEAVLSLDYDELKSPESIDYIKGEVMESLSGVTESVTNVYVSNIAIDFPGAVTLTDTQNNGTSEGEGKTKLRGLFNNLK